jgi:hypothetical protein
MKIEIFCCCSLFPSWSGQALISTPVQAEDQNSLREFDCALLLRSITFHLLYSLLVMLSYLIYRLIILIFEIAPKTGLTELNGINLLFISFKCVLLHTGSQCKTLSNDCAFLTCITTLPLIRSRCCTASNMTHMLSSKNVTSYAWCNKKVCELIAVKVLHTSLLNTAVVAFKVLPLGSYTPIPAPSPPFKTILNWFCGMA